MEPITDTVKKNGNKILHIAAVRCAKGLRVTVTGGEAIRRLFRDDLNPEVHGIPVCSSEAVTGWNLRIPPVPVLGPWILRAAQLGQAEGLTFVLAHPHSEAAVREAVAEIVNTATGLFVEYCQPIAVEGTAKVPA